VVFKVLGGAEFPRNPNLTKREANKTV
jgi:hypothetical protein